MFLRCHSGRVSITVDIGKAKEVFLEAVQCVDAGQHLPDEWVDRVRHMGNCPSKTFVAMLGTALLARATDPRVDPLVLKAGGEPEEGFESYSARAVATQALAPLAIANAVDIGTRGREPLNNQPFFRYTRVHRDMVVREQVRPFLSDLVDALQRLRELPRDELLPALAAFIAVRRSAARRPVRRIEVVSTSWTVTEFVRAVTGFVESWAEDGKRGQALVAAALDLVYPFVQLGHVNDPGRGVPGDVRAYVSKSSDVPTLSVEVKQKPVSSSDVMLWAASLASSGVLRGMYVTLSPMQDKLDGDGLVTQILDRHNVLVRLYSSASAFLRESMAWSSDSLETFLQVFPGRMQDRLVEAAVARESVEQWVQLFG